MKLFCPQCGQPIDGAQINIDKTLAVCGACGEVFNFADRIPARKRKTQKLKQPADVQMIEQGDQVTLRIPIKSPMAVISILMGIVFAVFGVGMSVAIASTALANGDSLFLGLSLGPSLFVGLMMYFLIGGLINHEEITLTADSLQQKVTPLPLALPRRHMLADIHHVSVESSATERSGGSERRYDVCLHGNDRRVQILVSDLTADSAHFVAQEIEAYLADDDAQDVDGRTIELDETAARLADDAEAMPAQQRARR
jgi:hypothetical protein